MIASLRGRLLEVLADGAVIEVGGVGYRVFLTPKAIATLPREGEVLVHTVTYVREDTLALYGFATTDERRAFEQLLTATGVGPKLALAVLAVHSPDALRRAVSAGDADALTLVPGVGRKGAARLLLELKGKLGDGPVEIPADVLGNVRVRGSGDRHAAGLACGEQPGARIELPVWLVQAGARHLETSAVE